MFGAMHIRLPWPPSTNTYYRSVLAVSNPAGTMGKLRRVKTVRELMSLLMRTVHPSAKISENGRAYARLVKAAVYDSCGGKPAAFLGPVHLTIDLYPPDRRRRDLDNHDGKAIFDALTKAGVWADDEQVKSRWGRMHPPEGDGCAMVTIEPMQTGELDPEGGA